MKTNTTILCAMAALALNTQVRADLPIVPLALSGEQVPGLDPGESYSLFTHASHAPTGGHVVFGTGASGVEINFNNDFCIMAGFPGSFSLIVREGTPAPAPFTSGQNFNFMSSPAVNAAGTLLFRSTVTGGDVGLFRRAVGGPIEVLAMTGSFVDNSGAVLLSTSIYGNRYPVDAAGNGFFYAALTGGGVSPSDNIAVLRAGTSGVSTIARTGITVPPGVPVNTPPIRFDVFYFVNANSSGTVVFIAPLRNAQPGRDEGIWEARGGQLSLVALRGNEVPGLPGVTFGQFGSGVGIGDDGTVGFCALLAGTGVTSDNEESLWIGKAGSLHLLVREGDAAPELDPGVVFDKLLLIGNGDIAPAINPAGKTAFIARVRGPGITDANNDSLWVQDGNGTLRLVIREGTVVPTTDVPSGISTGDPAYLPITLDLVDGFSTSNRLIFAAETFNGSYDGIYEASVPGDTIAPTARINGPKSRSSKRPSLRISGTASDNNNVLKVEAKVGGAPYRRVAGTAQWSFNARLKTGTNRILVRASDASGNLSPTVAVKVRRKR